MKAAPTTRIRKALSSRFAKFGSKVRCSLCGQTANGFLPFHGGWSEAPPVNRALDVVGSDLDNFGCPHCGSSDRERHLHLFLKRLELWSQFTARSVLHFAPEQRLSALIRELRPSPWVRADLFPAAPDIEKIDLCAIPYDENSFDIVIANHVLEHVGDDLKALSEIRRVLKPGGFALLQTPYSAKLARTLWDEGVDTDEARSNLYGQKDHVRLYGRDIFSRIESAGFRSMVSWHEEVLPDLDPAYYGVNVREPLFLFERI